MERGSMTAIEIIRTAHARQITARTKWIEPDDKGRLEAARRMATASLRMSEYPQLAELAPTAGEFEVAEFKIWRRRVDEIDNVYAALK